MAERTELASSTGIELSVVNHVALVSLDNSERRHVLDAPIAAALREAIEEIDDDSAVRCVVITGTGSTFATGADLKQIEANSAEENLRYNRQLRAAIDAVAALGAPSIAAVNGHAIGGGLELALACTLRVAATEARLGMPEARLGIIPATGGLARLPRLINHSTAARLLLSGDLVDGDEALRLGIVDAAVPAAEVRSEALALAERIAGAAPLATRAIVAALRDDPAVSIAAANARTEERLSLLLESADRHEGARAFLEHRDPDFTGS
jgi:enoyl-CoA hydratase/carnithine racemase